MANSTASGWDRRVAVTAFAIVVLVLAAAVAVRAGGPESTGPSSDLGDPALGDPAAPVTLVEYSDFGCPFCARHARDVKPAIVEEYVETGVVRYVWRDLPFQGDASVRAALAGRAAQAQGRFWDFHEAVFADAEARIDQEGLLEIAEAIGLDTEAFEEAVQTEAHVGAVEAGLEEGRRLGLSGTPSFTINGEPVLGAQPFEVFAEVIERAAAER